MLTITTQDQIQDYSILRIKAKRTKFEQRQLKIQDTNPDTSTHAKSTYKYKLPGISSYMYVYTIQASRCLLEPSRYL